MALIDRSHPELVEIKGKALVQGEELNFVRVETFKGNTIGEVAVKFWSDDKLPQFLRWVLDWRAVGYFRRISKKAISGKRLVLHYHHSPRPCCLWACKTETGVEFSQFNMAGDKEFAFEVAENDINDILLSLEHFCGTKTAWS